MDIQTHQEISAQWCGVPLEISSGYSRVELRTLEDMRVDPSGLVHGGFVFGLADYAAMIAVNHPNVVLGAAEVTFLKPVSAGKKLIAEAQVETREGKKQRVKVAVFSADQKVFEGVFTCFVLGKHVLG